MPCAAGVNAASRCRGTGVPTRGLGGTEGTETTPPLQRPTCNTCRRRHPRGRLGAVAPPPPPTCCRRGWIFFSTMGRFNIWAGTCGRGSVRCGDEAACRRLPASGTGQKPGPHAPPSRSPDAATHPPPAQDRAPSAPKAAGRSRGAEGRAGAGNSPGSPRASSPPGASSARAGGRRRAPTSTAGQGGPSLRAREEGAQIPAREAPPRPARAPGFTPQPRPQPLCPGPKTPAQNPAPQTPPSPSTAPRHIRRCPDSPFQGPPTASPVSPRSQPPLPPSQDHGAGMTPPSGPRGPRSPPGAAPAERVRRAAMAAPAGRQPEPV